MSHVLHVVPYSLVTALAAKALGRNCVVMLAVVLSLASCETETIGSKMVNDKALKPPPSLVEESYGHGQAELTLLLAKGANGNYDAPARDARDGAALAIGEL